MAQGASCIARSQPVSFLLSFLLFPGSGDGTQDCMHSRPVLHHWAALQPYVAYSGCC